MRGRGEGLAGQSFPPAPLLPPAAASAPPCCPACPPAPSPRWRRPARGFRSRSRRADPARCVLGRCLMGHRLPTIVLRPLSPSSGSVPLPPSSLPRSLCCRSLRCSLSAPVQRLRPRAQVSAFAAPRKPPSRGRRPGWPIVRDWIASSPLTSVLTVCGLPLLSGFPDIDVGHGNPQSATGPGAMHRICSAFPAECNGVPWLRRDRAAPAEPWNLRRVPAP